MTEHDFKLALEGVSAEARAAAETWLAADAALGTDALLLVGEHPELVPLVSRYAALVAEGREHPQPDDDAAIETAAMAAAASWNRRRSRRRNVVLAVAAVLVGAVATTLLLSSGGSEGSAGPTAAQVAVTRVNGLVSMDTGSGVFEPVTTTSSIGPGASIDTGDGGQLTMAAEGVADVLVDPRSRVRVAAWSADRVALEMVRGRIRADVEPRPDDSAPFEVRTPVARVVVMGTSFVTRHVPGEGTTVEGISGKVAVYRLADGELAGHVTAGDVLVVPAGVATSSADAAPTATAKAPKAAVVAPMEPDIAPAPKPEVTPDDPAVVPPTDTPGKTPPKRPRPPRKPSETDAKPPAAPPTPAEPSATPADATDATDAPTEPSISVDAMLAQARTLIAGKKTSKALDLLATLRGRGVALARLNTLYGDAYYVARRYKEAEGAWQKALAGSSADQGQVVMDLARLRRDKLGTPQAASKVLSSYLSAHPKGRQAAVARWTLAQLDAKAGRTKEARDGFSAVLKQHPRSRYANRALGKLLRPLLQSGNASAAEQLVSPLQKAANKAVAESATVGLMHVRRLQGRRGDVRSMAAAYRKRFPRGSRRAEVTKLETWAQAD